MLFFLCFMLCYINFIAIFFLYSYPFDSFWFYSNFCTCFLRFNFFIVFSTFSLLIYFFFCFTILFLSLFLVCVGSSLLENFFTKNYFHVFRSWLIVVLNLLFFCDTCFYFSVILSKKF